jgi:hypothetical protein
MKHAKHKFRVSQSENLRGVSLAPPFCRHVNPHNLGGEKPGRAKEEKVRKMQKKIQKNRYSINLNPRLPKLSSIRNLQELAAPPHLHCTSTVILSKRHWW